MDEFGVLCRRADGEQIVVTVNDEDAESARQQVLDHKALFYGGGDTAGRWLASQNPGTLVEVGEVRPWAEWMGCADCGVDTRPEGYMVHNELWAAAGMPSEPGHHYLCVGCLEARLERRLTPEDFTGAWINREDRRRSARLLDRLEPSGTQAPGQPAPGR